MAKKTRSELQHEDDQATAAPESSAPLVPVVTDIAPPEPNGYADPRSNMIERPPSLLTPQNIGSALMSRPTNVDLQTPLGRAIVFNSLSDSTVMLDYDGNAQLSVKWWFITEREVANPDTGELERYPWLTLIGPSGAAFGTSSGVVMHQWSKLIEWVENGIVSLPVDIIVSERKSRKRGQVFHSISLPLPKEE